MATATLESRLTAVMEAKAAESGLELVAVEVAGARKEPLVRVFLDREGGITIDDIAEASHWIQDVLEETPDLGAYTLEASSPGIERRLRKLSDFERFTGSDAKVTTRSKIEGRRNFTGRIAAVEGDWIVLDLDGATAKIPFAEIDKARLRVEIDFSREACDGI